MSKSKSTASRSCRPARHSPHNPITFQPGKGLAVSTGHNSFPETAEDKIIIAGSITKAVIRALDSEGANSDDLNFDPHWPLSMAVRLLEQAANQLDSARSAKAGAK